MFQHPLQDRDGSPELQVDHSLTSDGQLDVAYLCSGVSRISTDDSSTWPDITWGPGEQGDPTSDSTLTSGGGGDGTGHPVTQHGGYGGHSLSTVCGDGESGAAVSSASGEDASSVVSRWSDFVSSDDDFVTAEEDSGSVEPPAGLSPEHQLLRRLRQLGDDPGPVTGTTVGLYRRRLARLEARTAKFSPELDAAVAEGALLPPPALEEAAFVAPSGVVARRSCFNYLLLDPRVTGQRPADGQLPFATFVAAVFYVGKGQQSRPYSHLLEAAEAGTAGSAKVEHIRSVWRSGAGVTLLSVFHHRPAAEALTREAAMIDALGLRNLTNVRRGDYYGPAQAWPAERRRQLGAALLHRAWRIFLVEGETQLRPEDLGR